MSEVNNEDAKVWTDFRRAADAMVRLMDQPHSLHKLILNDIDHAAQNVRKALDANRYFWRHDLKTERKTAIVLKAPDDTVI